MIYYNNNTFVFLDGKFVKASEAKTDLFAQTLHYGCGVFEGLRAYHAEKGGSIFRAKDHFERFISSAEKLHMKVNYSVSELEAIAYQLMTLNGLKDAYIRPLAYSGANMRLLPAEDTHVFMGAWRWERYLGDKLLKVVVSPYEKPNPKSCIVEAKVVGQYVNSILASKDAKNRGYDEALLLDMNGNVAQAPGANFFFEKNGVLYTPPKGHILPGITRDTMFGLAKELGYKIKEEHFGPDVLMEADSAFFTGTAVEVAGIRSINGIELKGKWQDSMGYNLNLVYRQKVKFNDYQGLTIV